MQLRQYTQTHACVLICQAMLSWDVLAFARSLAGMTSKTWTSAPMARYSWTVCFSFAAIVMLVRKLQEICHLVGEMVSSVVQPLAELQIIPLMDAMVISHTDFD